MIEDYLVWRPQLEAILDPRFYTLDWLDEQVFNGDYKVWANEGGILLAELRHYPTGAKEGHAVIAAGDFEAINRLRPLAEQWAKDEGAVIVSVASRPGWAKAFKSAGYDLYQTTIRKELH